MIQGSWQFYLKLRVLSKFLYLSFSLVKMALVGLLGLVRRWPISLGDCRRIAAKSLNNVYTMDLGKNIYTAIVREIVTLVVATIADPASTGSASALLLMPGWNTGPSLQVSTLILSILVIVSSLNNLQIWILSYNG